MLSGGLSEYFIWAGLLVAEVWVLALDIPARWKAYAAVLLISVGIFFDQWGQIHQRTMIGVVAATVLMACTHQAISRTLAFRRRRRLEVKAAAIAATEKAEAERLEFESYPAELGIVDHGVNTNASMQAMLELLHQATPAIVGIMACLFKDTPSRLPPRNDPAHTIKKQKILKEAAETMRPNVLIIESIVPKLKEQAAAFQDAYRAMFGLPVESEGDKQALRDLRPVYSGGVASSFHQFSELTEKHRRDIARFSGNQKDLNRIVTRTTAAMKTIAAVTGEVATFCSSEMPEIIDRLLGDTDDSS